MRYQRVSASADLTASALGQILQTANPSFGRGWWDLYIGVRARMPVAPRWSLLGYVDVGGFGVGSDLTWQLLAGGQYDINDTYSAKFGYRFLHTDYDKRGFRHKSDMSGLFAGLGIKF